MISAESVQSPAPPSVDRIMDLYRKLANTAISWVLADRLADAHAAKVRALRAELGERDIDYPDPVGFKERVDNAATSYATACARERRCDAIVKEMARMLVMELER